MNMEPEAPKRIRLVIADDHPVLRAGLRALLSAEADMEVVGEAADGGEAVRRVRATQPSVVLLDLTMPRQSGLQIIPQIRQVCRHARVLVLTMHDDPSYLRAVLDAGGAGYVVKSVADTDLVSAIRAVAQGRMIVDLTVNGGALPKAFRGSSADPATATRGGKSLLSERERQVLYLVAHGHTNQEVASQLRISIKSVETYRLRVMEKLGLRSRAELVKYALTAGLLGQGDPGRPTS